MIIYLYVKTHNKTGLKYLGKTTRKNPHLYPGSGIRWRKHLDKHGYDYSTEIIKECVTNKEVAKWGLYYSNLWNVVESNQWANLTPEIGNGGSMSGKNARMFGKHHSESSKQKMSRSNKGKVVSEETRKKMSENHVGMTGKSFSESSKQKISISNKGKVVSEETRKKMKESSTCKKSVNTPIGTFSSITEAAIALKIHRDTIINRMKKLPSEYYFI